MLLGEVLIAVVPRLKDALTLSAGCNGRLTFLAIATLLSSAMLLELLKSGDLKTTDVTVDAQDLYGLGDGCRDSR